MKTRRIILTLAAGVVLVLAGAALFSSCGRSSNNGTARTDGTNAPSGKIAVYATDDMSDYRQVIATINRIDLMHTGTGNSCTVFTGPLSLDLANLSGVMQLINVASCPVVPYNRIHIEFAKSVSLMDLAGSTATCRFTSYKDEHNRPNTLACGPDTCTLDINGAVNLVARGSDKLALDFVLKDFEIEQFGTAACSVTMKVSPIHGREMESRGNPEDVTGLISNLSTTDRTFTLTKGNETFTVLYSGITSTLQPGLDTLLQRAQTDQLRVKVTASQIDYANNTITASALCVKIEGTIAAGSLTATTFSLNYKTGMTLSLDYSSAIVEGMLAEEAWVEAKLYGFDGTNFLADRVEVQQNGTKTED
jgi:hypothetical protein